jgi:hypothetical protein
MGRGVFHSIFIFRSFLDCNIFLSLLSLEIRCWLVPVAYYVPRQLLFYAAHPTLAYLCLCSSLCSFLRLVWNSEELHAVTKLDGFNANFNLQNYDCKLPMDIDDLCTSPLQYIHFLQAYPCDLLGLFPCHCSQQQGRAGRRQHACQQQQLS